MWIHPEKLTTSWHPESFTPEYQELDYWLLSGEGKFVSIGDTFKVAVPVYETENLDGTWLLLQAKNKLEIIKYKRFENKQVAVLPPEAILMGRWYSDGKPAVLYWNETFFGKGCYLVDDIIVLLPSKPDSSAWLVSELTSKMTQLQIKRSFVGKVYGSTTIHRLSTDVVSRIKYKIQPEYVLLEINNEIVAKVKKYSEELVGKLARYESQQQIQQVLLTGATFEERMTQFEEYMVQQKYFSEPKSFYIEMIGSDKSPVDYIVRPLRTSWNNKKSSATVGRFDDAAIVYIEKSRINSQLTVQEDVVNDNEWMAWVNDLDSNSYCVYHAGVDSPGLPTDICTKVLRQIVPSDKRKSFSDGKNNTFPSYTTYKDILNITENRSLYNGNNDYLSYWVEDRSAKMVLIELYSPALAIKVLRDSKLVGIYLFLSDFEIGLQPHARSILEGYGSELSRLVSQISVFVSDAARRESLRRLSDVMHKLNGPVGRATSALNDIEGYVKLNPDFGNTLLPDEIKAKGRAAMNKEDISNHTLAARLKVLNDAIQSIRKVSYQVKRLSLVQGEMIKTCTCITDVVCKCADIIKGVLPEAIIECNVADKYSVIGNEDVLSSAIDEVLNNAARELKEHQVVHSKILIKIWRASGFIHMQISDNGLPVTTPLINNPFEESASTYQRSGRGSGLGLTIVKETFLGHGGDCKLYENFDSAGVRAPGVTFEASLPECVI